MKEIHKFNIVDAWFTVISIFTILLLLVGYCYSPSNSYIFSFSHVKFSDIEMTIYSGHFLSLTFFYIMICYFFFSALHYYKKPIIKEYIVLMVMAFLFLLFFAIISTIILIGIGKPSSDVKAFLEPFFMGINGGVASGALLSLLRHAYKKPKPQKTAEKAKGKKAKKY